jgi:hypothetical protein
MHGAIPPLLNTPSRRGAQLQHRDNFTFTFYRTSNFDLGCSVSGDGQWRSACCVTGVPFRPVQGFSCTPPRSDRLWNPPNLLSNRYQGLLGIKRPERQSDHSPPSGPQVKNVWSFSFIPPFVFVTYVQNMWLFIPSALTFGHMTFLRRCICGFRMVLRISCSWYGY